MLFKQLMYFVEFCREKNFSQTAHRLFITPQGLSKSVHLLEEDLGVPLVTSDSGKLELTPCGEYLAKEGKQLLNQMELLRSNLHDMYQSPNKGLVINMSSSIRSVLPASVHNEFMQQNPHIPVTICQYPDMESERMLADGQLDAIIGIGPLENSLCQTHFMFNIPFIVMMHSSNPLAQKSILRLSDLVGQPIVAMDKQFKTHYLFPEVCRRQRISLNVVDYAYSALTLVYACRENKDYIGLLFNGMQTLFTADEQMSYIPLDTSDYMVSVIFATLKSRFQSDALCAYSNFICSYDFSDIPCAII